MSDNDPKDRKEKEDLTRIEDLSDFFHNEEEDFSDLDSHSDEDTDFEEMATDPDMELPPEFTQEEESTDFSALEDDESPPTLPEDSTQSFSLNSEEEENDFASEDNDFGAVENDFGAVDNDFAEEDNNFAAEENDFGAEENDFGAVDNDFGVEENDFGAEENDFGAEDNDFGAEDNDFAAEENDFGSVDNDFNAEENNFDSNSNKIEEDDNSSLFNDDLDSEEINDPPISNINSSSLEQEQTNKNEIEEKTEIPKYVEEKPYKAPENFQELQNFSKNMAYGNMAREGNPPFSIILKDIKYEEDLEDIVILLKEFKIITEESEAQAKESLRRGSYLIPRLGEYAAITLCHKLRRFELNILMGLTEEIHPAKSYDSDDRGLTTKNNIFNNRKHNWNFEEANLTIDDLLTSTTSTLDGHEVLEYISIGTEYTVISSNDLNLNNLENENKDQADVDSLKHIYNDLLNKLKASALNKKANAIIGINYQTTPIANQHNHEITTQYQIVCSGSFVWVSKR